MTKNWIELTHYSKEIGNI